MQHYFEDYARAFVARDMDKIAPHFAYPCMLINAGGVDVVYDDDALHQHLQGFIETLAANDIAHIRAVVRDETHHDPTRASVLVQYTMENSTGKALDTFSFLYVLVKDTADADWQIRLAEAINP